jgi:hypothetical protein
LKNVASVFPRCPLWSIAVGYGAGGEARQPLGLVVVGGLIFSQLVTLYLTPVFFTYVAHLQNWLKHAQWHGLEPESSKPSSLAGTNLHS